jgi:uncharacterized glyoxalase superfamily protein PhnB
MLTSLFPYLNFDGNAKEATHYYVEALDGELLGITTFGEAPEDDSTAWLRAAPSAWNSNRLSGARCTAA